ncbi:TMEM175 family protein [Mucilaginibacter polytrichastri]|uniref:DUF1211 domain-containing protein n=1 Tax=Mucilaginibacter polytrichastri TaxID=1302689 RepID=A0A1Q5ZVP6_9SPHI|nr:TMEM175 family protein [Mucilaginibacter polytrichastri]OKS85847.1 hypothetical protein RG47T_1293 [Mucilaginibacter polytrichastri]SFS61093.1 Uncharacterized membrane protein [Mucilaginibacter polytrichastri]
MKKGRLEAFSDGVIAIIITIMVLELKVPHSADLHALLPLMPVFFCYLLSFVYVGIYWNNHHHMIYLVDRIDGKILWANLNLLFWLSLIPFVTAWMGENHFAQWPVFFYGGILAMNAGAYTLLAYLLIKRSGKDSILSQAFGHNWKSITSVILYLVGMAVAFYKPLISIALYIIVAMIWFIPDTRVERKITAE